jgi:hypothetical protein
MWPTEWEPVGCLLSVTMAPVTHRAVLSAMQEIPEEAGHKAWVVKKTVGAPTLSCRGRPWKEAEHTNGGNGNGQSPIPRAHRP